jgi:hypothetical protein
MLVLIFDTDKGPFWFSVQGSVEILSLQSEQKWAFVCVKDQNKHTEKRGVEVDGVGVGMILSISKKKKEVKRKFEATEGGSRIEFESAGFDSGNWASITVENEQVLTRE